MTYTGSQLVEKIKNLNLPLDKCLAVGGSSLAIRGMRETRDLDIVVLPEVFEMLQKEGWVLDSEYESRWNRKRLKRDDVEIYPDLFLETADRYLNVEDLLKNADIVEGIHVQDLENLILCKLDSAREKDLKDVTLIQEYLRSEG